LSDVGTGASNNDVLQWDGDSWEPATPTLEANVVITCSGAVTTPSTSPDAYDELQAAFNTSTLGYNVTRPITTSTVSILDLQGRTFSSSTESPQGTGITLPATKGVTYRNGTLNYNKVANNGRVMSYISSNEKISLLTAQAENGHTKISITGTDVGDFNVGDHIYIQAKTSTGTLDPYDVYHQINAYGTSPISIGSADHAIVTQVDEEADVLHLDKPLSCGFTIGSQVIRHGLGTNGQDQFQNNVFENMTFTREGSGIVFLGDDPLTVTATNDEAVIEFPTGHGLSVGHGIIVRDIDASVIGGTDAVSAYNKINNKELEVEGVSTNDITITMGEASGIDGELGGDVSYAILTNDYGITLKDASNIVFRNCTFRGFNRSTILLTRCYKITFEGCTFEDCNSISSSSRGTVTIRRSDTITFNNCRFEKCTNGINFYNATQGTGEGGTETGFETNFSSNLTVTNCYFHCLRGIYAASRGVYGTVTITNNKFSSWFINDKTAHLSNASHTHGIPQQAIYLRHVEALNISDNIMNSYRKVPSGTDTFVGSTTDHTENAFWGEGTGFTPNDLYVNETKGRRYPGFKNGISIFHQPNPYESTNAEDDESQGRHGSSKGGITVNNNSIACWYNSGVVLQVEYNKILGGKQDYGPIMVSNNSIVTGGYGVNIGHRDGDETGVRTEQITRTHISDNVIRNQALWKIIPGTVNNYGESTANWAGGANSSRVAAIFLNPNSTRTGTTVDSTGCFLDTTITNNNISTSYGDDNTGSSGILLSDAAGDSQTFDRLMISGNFVTNFRYGLGIYRDLEDLGKSIAKRGFVTGNYFYSFGNTGILWEESFTASGQGNFSTNNQQVS